MVTSYIYDNFSLHIFVCCTKKSNLNYIKKLYAKCEIKLLLVQKIKWKTINAIILTYNAKYNWKKQGLIIKY